MQSMIDGFYGPISTQHATYLLSDIYTHTPYFQYS